MTTVQLYLSPMLTDTIPLSTSAVLLTLLDLAMFSSRSMSRTLLAQSLDLLLFLVLRPTNAYLATLPLLTMVVLKSLVTVLRSGRLLAFLGLLSTITLLRAVLRSLV